MLNKLWLRLNTRKGNYRQYVRDLYTGHSQYITRHDNGTYTISTYDGTNRVASKKVKHLWLEKF